MNLELSIGLWVLSSVVALVATILTGPSGALGVTAMLLLGAVCAAIVRLVDRRRGLALTEIFFVALAVRIVAAVLIEHVAYSPDFLDRPGLFAPDELQYLYEAKLLALQWDGRAPSFGSEASNWITTTTRMAAGLFYLFGDVNLIPKLVMCTLGAWTAVFTALIAEELFPSSGRRAGYLAALFPSLVLWTSLVLKDGLALFGVELFLTAFVLRMGRSRLSLPLVAFAGILGLAAIAGSRTYELGFLCIAVAGSIFVGRGGRLGRNLGLYVVVSLALVFVMQRYFQQPVDFTGDESPLAKVASIRSGFAEGTGSAVRHDIVDVRSPTGLLMWIPIGLAYFFFAPLPFTGSSITSVATSPEMIVWYVMIPSVWRGMRAAVQQRSTAFLAVFLFAVSSAIGWSILVTNVGTIYRFRAQMFFVPLILAAYDHAMRKRARSPAPAPVATSPVSQTTSSTAAG